LPAFVIWYLIVILIWISLISGFAHFFIYLLVTYMFSFEKCLFQSIAHF
jgi:hypothetical protein